jgi:hypothetical protein
VDPAATAHPVCARLLVEEHWGERDLRVCVSPADGPGPVVELLWPGPDAGGEDCWHAVLVREAERCLWRGPARPWPPRSVARFAADLLALGPAQLAERYRPVG